MIITRDPDAPRAALENLILRAAEPNISASIRATQARAASDEYADLLDLVRAAGVLPGAVLDTIQASDDIPLDLREEIGAARRGAAAERIAARRVVAEARAITTVTATNVPGTIGNFSGVAPYQTHLGDGLPLIRSVAIPWTEDGLPLVPLPPTGTLVGEIVPPGVAPAPSGASFTISDVSGVRWTQAAAVGDLARQVVDFGYSDSVKILDQIFQDVTDRAAEISVATSLIAAGTAAAVSGGDVAGAIDTAESLASGALNAPADFVICSPVNLPKIRRAVAASWTTDPHPIILASMGVPAGTAIVTGRSAFILIAKEISFQLDRSELTGEKSTLIAKHAARLWSIYVGAVRDFIYATMVPGGIRVVTGI